MGKKLKFGFSLKKKKKSKAELWQEGAPAPPEPYNPDSYDREGPPYEDEPYYDAEQPSAPYDEDSPSYNRATMVSQRSHPDYDPYNADYYIPSSNRKTQFDNSVLMQREQDTKEYNDGSEATRTETYPDERYQSPQQQYERSYERPPWKRGGKGGDYGDEPQPYDESEYSAESYPKREDYQDPGDFSEPRRERTSHNPELSDINEDQERYFQQQEWNDTASDDGRGGRSYGAKMVEMCDNMAEGISEALSRFFQSASLFCKTCFWSRNSS